LLPLPFFFSLAEASDGEAVELRLGVLSILLSLNGG
jgi:hypothetical protein